jgi:hypothetical protein
MGERERKDWVNVCLWGEGDENFIYLLFWLFSYIINGKITFYIRFYYKRSEKFFEKKKK